LGFALLCFLYDCLAGILEFHECIVGNPGHPAESGIAPDNAQNEANDDLHASFPFKWFKKGPLSPIQWISRVLMNRTMITGTADEIGRSIRSIASGCDAVECVHRTMHVPKFQRQSQ
jgi:hypothetical protein